MRVISEGDVGATPHSCSACSGDVRQAARSAASYMLFDPEDNVMQPGVFASTGPLGPGGEDFQPREVGIAKTFSEPVILIFKILASSNNRDEK